MTERNVPTPDAGQPKPLPPTLIASSLVLAYILSSFPIMLLGLFILDMAQLFGVEVGMMAIARSRRSRFRGDEAASGGTQRAIPK